MTTPAPDILVDTTILRVGAWLSSFEEELRSARKRHGDLGENGAVAFVHLLDCVLSKYRNAYDRFRTQHAAPPSQRLQWLQQVGAGLAQLENLFGRLAVPVAPTLTPLLEAFTRLLEPLVPGCPPIFRPVRDFNYEIEEVHAGDFVPLLGGGVQSHPWPLLFITLPTGLLDSPRSHILVSHEIGHAIAAAHREKVDQRETERRDATAAGTSVPSAIPSLLPRPSPTRKEISRIVRERWKEMGLPPIKPPIPGQQQADVAVLMQLLAQVSGEIDELCEFWLEELFSDAVGTCLFGPAFLVAMLETLLTTGSMERGTSTHPPLAARLLCIGKTLQHTALGFSSQSFPPNLRARFDASMAEAQSTLQAPSTTASGEVMGTVKDLVLNRIDEIVQVAVDRIQSANVLYTAQQFADDVERFVSRFVKLGVPPIDASASLASVFNVGQVLCSDHLHEFCPGLDDDAEKERRIDDLLLKAIELNEVSTRWKEPQ